MLYRTLGSTCLRVSTVAFGAGPISGLLVGDDVARQRAVVKYAVEQGVNWFDTAATYGRGQSEIQLGRTFAELGVDESIHIASKVRLVGADLLDIRGAVRRSLEESLRRLGRSRLTLLQLHNSVTPRRGDEPTSLTPADVLGPGGVLEALEELRSEGRVDYFGLTGIGRPESMKEVVRSGAFATIQVPYHLLNASAGQDASTTNGGDTDYGNIIAACAEQRMGVFVIRVLAGGALADAAPSPHTLNTPFFPLDLYERDRRRAAQLRAAIGPDRRLPIEAVRFAVSHPQVTSAIIGFAETWQVDEALTALQPDPSPVDWNSLLARHLPSVETVPCRTSAT